ncbi:5'-3' exoribonuclease 1 [Drosophila willistoni]|uniref:5'-3' exoribonuclease 1 n=1 Tax=Drosophila willistoni TaxID=7260 RepID=UPI000C26D442|nr:5'-3' exoribonuclease 1 [Drosophila willistoni]
MGVPKFFRYISERYPCLSELAREHCIPEFDNLYLDMNGIVHNCSHPDDANIHFHLEEDQIFQDIFNYVEKLFHLIKPQKLFFLSVDGVAPRAKMNQQRSRRFRTAREAEQLETKASQRGEKRQHERFDSNCITPGTVFMERLQLALRSFLRTKISLDPLWQKCRVILSGEETPGEGEHKIMDYIRYLKSQPNFDPNTRHCLYGLDADLIILGLCTHELHFVVLREEVKFGRNVKRATLEETRFYLLHLGLLREYLELEFNELSTKEKKLDVAQLIDDWVLMGFMVGNDFIPNLPCLHISSNALPLLYKTYIQVYPQLGGNINERGKLNLRRLQIFMTALSEVELQQFEDHFDDLKYMNAKTEAFDVDVSEIQSASANGESFNSDLVALIDNSMKLYDYDSDDEEHFEDLTDEASSLRHEFQNYKRNYYRNKFKREMKGDLVEELTHHYITALQWILDYYYRGVQSWDWYYPFHYAPFISDLKNIENVKIHFQLGRPFLPFQQLLAVLPAASSKLLPIAYHDLMLNPDSALAEFYPTEFESDLNGKKHDWEAVVLIPFIDERRLLEAMRPCENCLTTAERSRNQHGPMYQYDFSEQSVGSMPSLGPIKALQHVFCTETARWAKEIALNLPESVCVELPNKARHVFFPGFPTMKHLPFNFELRNDRVKVFEQVSRNQNMVLMPLKRTLEDTLTAVAGQYLEQVVHIGWPHLIKAKVVRVATRDERVDENGLSANDSRRFDSEGKSLQEHFSTRMGIKFDNYDVLVYVRTYAGSSVEFGKNCSVYTKDAWSSTVTGYPAQGLVANLAVHENMKNQFRKIEELFPVGSQVFFIGNPYYGSEGTVLDPLLVYSCGRVQVNIRVHPEPDLQAARLLQEERENDYINSYEACRYLNINSKALGRLTGTVWVVLGPRREKMENVAKHNIGLQLKYPRQNEERAGYCQRLNNQWFFSTLALELMQTYCDLYPNVVAYFSIANDRNEFIYEEDIYPDAVGQHNIEDLANWIRQQPHMKVERNTCGSKTVCKETVELLLTTVDELRSLPVKDVKLQVKPHLLIKPNVTLPEVYRARRTVRLFDRVIVVRTIYMVPLGAKGTVIGIHLVSDPNPVRLECVNSVETFCDILFDKTVPNCNDIHGIAEERVYRVPESALVVIFTSNDGKAQKSQPLQQRQQDTVQKPQQHQAQAGSSNRRYITAAGTKTNQITMKTDIADEFVKPVDNNAGPGVGANWRDEAKDTQRRQQQLKQHKDVPKPDRTSGLGPGPGPDNRAKSRGKNVGAPQDQSLQSTSSPNSGANWREKAKETPSSQDQTSTSPPRTTAANWREQGKSNQRQQETQHYKDGGKTPNRQQGGSNDGGNSQDQTLALKNLLGIQKFDQKPTAPHQSSLPLPSMAQQMPKLPKPPLFWQQEAQAERIQSQEWYRKQQDEKPPLMHQQHPLQPQQPQQQQQLQYQTQQQQQHQHKLQYLQKQQPQQFYSNSNNNVSAPFRQNAGMTIFIGNNNYPAYPPPQQHQQQHHHQQHRAQQVKQYQQHQQDQQGSRYSSIQDFVPIQAYRPKKGQRKDAESIESTQAPAKDSRKENEKSQPIEQVEPEQAKCSTADEQVRATSSQTITNKTMPQRKQRVPRIGAKFDFDYILH